MFNRRFLPCLASGLALAATLAAAPSRLTPTGPFGTFDSGVEELVFPGSDPRQLLIRTPFDLFLSRDAGFAWRSVLSNFPQIRPAALAVDGAEGGRWYVTDAAGPGSRVWWSADQGASWSALPLPALPAGQRRLSFFADRFQPANLALEVFFPAEGIYHRYASTSRGQAWTELAPAGLSAERQEILGLGGGSLYFRTLRYELASGAASPIGFEAVSRLFFDRTRPATLYVAVDGGPFGTLFSSTNRGATLVRLREYGLRVRFLAQSPANSSHMAIGDADGLVLSLDRGNTWTPGAVLPAATARQAAFDPASGELLLAGKELIRRHLDGSLAAPAALHGLRAATIVAIGAGQGAQTAFALDLSGRVFLRDRQGRWQRQGQLAPADPSACLGDRRLVLRPDQPGFVLVACENSGLYASSDFGWTWTHSPLPTTVTHWGTFDLAASGSSYFLLANSQILRSPDGTTWERLFVSIDGNSGFAVHPEPARGVVGVNSTGGISRLLPNGDHEINISWLPGGGVEPGGHHSKAYPFMTIAHDPNHGDLIYAVHGSILSRSVDFGETWEARSDLRNSPLGWDEDLPITEALIDPFDGAHLLLLDRGLESRDGGRTFFASESAFGPAAFGREIADHFLQARPGDGVLEQTANLPVCPDRSDAWCAGGGRYLVTVEWKTAQGQEGRAGKIATGNAGSGLFYFFDPNNWELLVKVLDGCAINQRQWVFAAGTTDVEYELRVEDRWTGQIRHYANQPGQAAAAITDTQAFAGCGAAPPPGEPDALLPAAGEAGEPQLDLLSGRFAVTTRWTDFGGHQGDGLTAPLASANSGLFYFFDPSNWEVLVKVLDGCAINQHYWVLAAATTDVGFELKVSDRQRQTTKTYRNPVGQAAPATLDLRAFPCAN